jgi:cyclopropane fatty-acyl-phospholipid synthase-like methyltransferase
MRQRFPTDPRNLAAIDLLNQIASQVLSDADWHRLEPHFALTSAAWQHAVSEASRVVGFKTHSPELGSFVRNVVGLLECTQ